MPKSVTIFISQSAADMARHSFMVTKLRQKYACKGGRAVAGFNRTTFRIKQFQFIYIFNYTEFFL